MRSICLVSIMRTPDVEVLQKLNTALANLRNPALEGEYQYLDDGLEQAWKSMWPDAPEAVKDDLIRDAIVLRSDVSLHNLRTLMPVTLRCCAFVMQWNTRVGMTTERPIESGSIDLNTFVQT
eukprot:GHVU01092172.1.p2 GENE.GHVU01092172.1~~GHVU01092172.1.p2  ORF type:complete len:122 (-),score=7.50 GHVU01092172.1:115-480(-)